MSLSDWAKGLHSFFEAPKKRSITGSPCAKDSKGDAQSSQIPFSSEQSAWLGNAVGDALSSTAGTMPAFWSAQYPRRNCATLYTNTSGQPSRCIHCTIALRIATRLQSRLHGALLSSPYATTDDGKILWGKSPTFHMPYN